MGQGFFRERRSWLVAYGSAVLGRVSTRLRYLSFGTAIRYKP
jgi:hypothetical protein